jgi:hypothetical protein
MLSSTTRVSSGDLVLFQIIRRRERSGKKVSLLSLSNNSLQQIWRIDRASNRHAAYLTFGTSNPLTLATAKQMNHAAGSLEEIVENLVKNWEVEASYKSRLSDWRTIDHENYSFAMNGGAPSTGEQMIKTGTYNGIIVANEFYDPKYNDFASSHKSFKRMMPTFAWEVLEVYSAGPPQISFRWRHWGEMKNDYVGFNEYVELNPLTHFPHCNF